MDPEKDYCRPTWTFAPNGHQDGERQTFCEKSELVERLVERGPGGGRGEGVPAAR
ncbi:MAG: hypothetical protein NVSMB4_12750 [Acidimicrobiales bacterium]